MDFSSILQLRTKKFWWMDVILYFVISLLIATILCYLIFLAKNSLQREDIQKETAALQTVGTDQQKEYEKEVMAYQKKINDFTNLLNNHEFASNVFAFMQAQTRPDIWFKQFNLDAKNSAVQLLGESDNMDTFSRQVAVFEGNKYVKNISDLKSALGAVARIQFNINLALDQNIFSYLSMMPLVVPAISQTTVPAGQQGQTTPADNSTEGTQSSEKLITSFHLPLNPEVIGAIDETKFAITLSVPYGTGLKNLMPSIIISPGATVLPDSNVPQDFMNPVTYKVIAQDGSAQNYTVSVIVATPPGKSDVPSGVKSSQSEPIALIVVLVIAIVIIAAIFLSVWRKIKSKKSKL